MLNEQKLQKVAEKAARAAVNLLSMEKKYTVKLINDPEIIQDALFGTQENEILIHYQQLKSLRIDIQKHSAIFVNYTT